MTQRVVVTGLGVAAPNGLGVPEFLLALRKGESGVRHVPELERLNFGCQVAGIPPGVDARVESSFAPEMAASMNSNQRHTALAATEAWEDAGLESPKDAPEPDWDSGAVMGTCLGGLDSISQLIGLVDRGRVRSVGSRAVEQVMASGISARISGLLGLGNQVTTNASACCTGAEAILAGARHIRAGRAKRMLCGGSEGTSPYTWAGFDSMRILSRGFNQDPTRASRPLSESAAGFVPAAGAGVLLLESLESALERGARIHAEVLGGAANSGGHRGGGSMTAPNPKGVQQCIRGALIDAAVDADEIDTINGHLTATRADVSEVHSFAAALSCEANALPPITATKSLIGHALSAAGGIESVACVLMLEEGFLHPSINCEDLHPRLEPFAKSIVRQAREAPHLRTLLKAAFGFGDVNTCVVFRHWDAA